MGEAILSRGYAGSSGGSGGGGNQNIANNGMITEIFTADTLWRAPENLRNGQVHVRLFGGGASGLYNGFNSSGGGSGNMNNGFINITNGEEVYISIGSGGNAGSYSEAGGTTAFGVYLYATGGSTSDGGSGGGASGGKNGGNATYGGGGGYGMLRSEYDDHMPGNGGIYGGGGGGASVNLNLSKANIDTVGIGGQYGGNGGYIITCAKYEHNRRNAETGTNTIGMGLEFEGNGSIVLNTQLNRNAIMEISGGGGYGGRGGSGMVINNNINTVLGSIGNACGIGGGGGGGYGADGGNGGICSGGGGGGYGGKGGDGFPQTFNGTSTSHKDTSSYPGGGGGYGKYGFGGSHNKYIAGIAAGGSGSPLTMYRAGGSGICILQYWLD